MLHRHAHSARNTAPHYVKNIETAVGHPGKRQRRSKELGIAIVPNRQNSVTWLEVSRRPDGRHINDGIGAVHDLGGPTGRERRSSTGENAKDDKAEVQRSNSGIGYCGGGTAGPANLRPGSYNKAWSGLFSIQVHTITAK